MRGYTLFPQLLSRLGRHPQQPAALTAEEMERAMVTIRSGGASRAQVGAFLTALRIKGFSAAELRGAVEGWQEGLHHLDLVAPVLHMASGFTGQIRTIDLSLPASLVAAASGARVVLLGADSQPPTYGITAGDLLRALGVKTQLHPGEVEASLASIGWSYAYFPHLHPKFARLTPIRKELGVHTILDSIEQLLAPAGTRFMLVSVDAYHQGAAMAQAMAELGVERGAVVLGMENSIDLPLHHPATIWRIGQGSVAERTFNARDYGLEPVPIPGPAGLTLKGLARMYEEILSGQPHPFRQAVQLNAAHALYVAGLTDDFGDALRRADEALQYGSAYRKLKEFRSNFALK